MIGFVVKKGDDVVLLKDLDPDCFSNFSNKFLEFGRKFIALQSSQAVPPLLAFSTFQQKVFRQQREK